MPRFQYAGQAPVDDGEGGVVRPGDIRDTEPDWGPWTELPDEDGPEKPADVPAVPAPVTERARPATAATAPPVTVPDQES